jgi:hypothetical protein
MVNGCREKQRGKRKEKILGLKLGGLSVHPFRNITRQNTNLYTFYVKDLMFHTNCNKVLFSQIIQREQGPTPTSYL